MPCNAEPPLALFLGTGCCSRGWFKTQHLRVLQMCCSLCSMHQASKPRSFHVAFWSQTFPLLGNLDLFILLCTAWFCHWKFPQCGWWKCRGFAGQTMPALTRRGLAHAHSRAPFPLCLAHKGCDSAASRGADTAFMYLRRPRNPERFKSHSSMSIWQGVKLFYMHFAQMEMSTESVGGC